jgi:hypothetical protein
MPKNSIIKPKSLVFFVFVLALILRLYGLNWDQGNHLHPDERMISMVASGISVPHLPEESSFLEKIDILFNPISSLNPHFFAYGSFPIYLLKAASAIASKFDPNFLVYDKINLVGRFLSALFDSLTVVLVYKLSLYLFKSSKKGIFAALVYASSVLPIQLSHFYAVDTILNFFIFLTLYFSIKLYQNFNIKNATLVGIGFGLSLSTKISATVLVISLGFGLIVGTLLSFKKEIFGEEINFLTKTKKYLCRLFAFKFWNRNRLKKLNIILFYFCIILLAATATFFVFEPFAVSDFSEFWRQINEQQLMTKNAFVFPYTLQYINTTPYLYQLKNIYLWGLGTSFGLAAFVALIFGFKELIKGLLTRGDEDAEGAQLIVYSFFIVYFAVVGLFAVKFMRYCLPLYPVFALLIGNLFGKLSEISSSKNSLKLIPIVFFGFNLIWLCAFMNIYNTPNTRIVATDWINNNIPENSLILREHWDDGMPLKSNKKFITYDLKLYDSDIYPEKWQEINEMLKLGDYIIIASNRLYTPLMKLTDCNKLPQDKCYNLTSAYYQDLFSGKLGYFKVAEFSNSPSFFNFNFNDQSADESFTVYDHPKIMIFKKQI